LKTTWYNYWFKPTAYLDLAVLRIVAVGLQLFIITFGFGFDFNRLDRLSDLLQLPEHTWEPILVVKFLSFPLTLEWGAKPTYDMLIFTYYLSIVAGLLALFGFFTRINLFVFAVTNIFLQGFIYSFREIHHPEAIMMIALCALAISPCAKVLSVDAWVAETFGSKGDVDLAEYKGEYAGWPIKLLQWFFVLMYLSACYSKITIGSGEWHNGFTLQYYLLQDGYRWDRPLAKWLSQWHELILFLQYTVMIFQATFVLPVVFPRLRWIYVPVGLGFHTGIWMTLGAPFPQWIALYVIFIPWAAALKRVREDRKTAPLTHRHEAP